MKTSPQSLFMLVLASLFMALLAVGCAYTEPAVLQPSEPQVVETEVPTEPGVEVQSEVATEVVVEVVVDVCSDTALKGVEIDRFTRLMSQFDDVSILAQITPKEQMAVVILKMQDIKHETENQKAPACLEALKDAQIDYLNVVIQTMFGFLGGASGERLNADILLSRELRQVYEEEKANALGVPYATPTARVALVPATPSAEGTTVTTGVPTGESTPVTTQITATSLEDIRIMQYPFAAAGQVGSLLTGQTVEVRGRLETNDWLLIVLPEAPDMGGWVFASFMQLSVEMAELPVVEAPEAP